MASKIFQAGKSLFINPWVEAALPVDNTLREPQSNLFVSALNGVTSVDDISAENLDLSVHIVHENISMEQQDVTEVKSKLWKKEDQQESTNGCMHVKCN